MSTLPSAEAIQIVRGDAGDLGGVMRIMNSAFDPGFGEAWTRSQCAGILPMAGVSLLLAYDGYEQPSGFSLFRTVASEAELLLLAVAPNHQRRGIGQHLLEQFVECARTAGARRIHLEVRDGNPAAAMYRLAGFEPAGRRPNYYRGTNGRQFDALTFARAL